MKIYELTRIAGSTYGITEIIEDDQNIENGYMIIVGKDGM